VLDDLLEKLLKSRKTETDEWKAHTLACDSRHAAFFRRLSTIGSDNTCCTSTGWV